MPRPAQLVLLLSVTLSFGLLAAAMVPAAQAGPPAFASNGPDGRLPGILITPTLPGPTPTLVIPAYCASVIVGRVPNAAINQVFADPARVLGYGDLCNPNLPPSPYNVPRTWLSLVDPAKPYHPVYNGLVFKCGCP